MGYPSTATLVAASTVAELTGLTAPQQDALRVDAIAAVETYTKQVFTVEGTVGAPVTKLIDGNGYDVLYLPRRLASLASVTVDGTLLQPPGIGFDVTPEKAALKLTTPLGGTWLTRVRLRPYDPPPMFPTGRDNVAVAGVWGWTDAEWAAGDLAAVALALQYDMEDKALANANPIAASARAMRALGVSSGNEGGVSLTIKGGEPDLSARAKRKLARLCWDFPVGARA